MNTTSFPPSPPPYTRLYKHALESIFAHLCLSELACITATCQDWSAAVDSMRPISVDFTVEQQALQSMCNSHLLRHLSGIRLIIKKGLVDVADLTKFCSIVQKSNSLATVDLSSNAIGDIGASAIAKAIQQQSTSLTSVELGGNAIGVVGAFAIAEAIKQSKSLTTVDLRWN